MQLLTNRYSAAPLTGELNDKLNFSEEQIGLILTYFYASFVFGNIFFGILGDRYSRKLLIEIDLFMEGIALLVSAITPKFSESSYFYVFIAGRFIMGLFQASFISIGPTVIADMFTDDATRTKMTGIFCAAPALGIAFCFLGGAQVAGWFGWQFVYYFYALREFLNKYSWN